ncbi:MAG: lipoprotein [Pseudomonadota bacterium]
MSRLVRALSVVLVLVITACGQAGDLYLPGQARPTIELPPADNEETKDDDEDAAVS